VTLTSEFAHALALALAEATPREFVGAIGGVTVGTTWQATTLVALPNTATDATTFRVDPFAFATAEATLRTRHAPWLGFVHNHPCGDHTLSAVDRAALWQRCLQLVVAGTIVTDTGLGAYWLDEHGARPIPLVRPSRQPATSRPA
jgi:proteasome lid subunit RPN8/RPN11